MSGKQCKIMTVHSGYVMTSFSSEFLLAQYGSAEAFPAVASSNTTTIIYSSEPGCTPFHHPSYSQLLQCPDLLAIPAIQPQKQHLALPYLKFPHQCPYTSAYLISCRRVAAFTSDRILISAHIPQCSHSSVSK